MSRKIKYTKPYLQTLWADFESSGRKLKEYCKTTNGEDGKPLNYISIYTALRKNKIMEFLKKNKGTKVAAQAPVVETPPPVANPV